MNHGSIFAKGLFATLWLMLGCSSPAIAAGAEEQSLLQARLTQAPGQQLSALTVTYAPGQSTPPHHHDADAFVYVLSGHIRSQLADGPVKVYGVGQSWFEPAGTEHRVSGNASSSEPASMLVVFVAKPSAELMITK
ncbi:cupin domain-containing protein [Dyella silvatica]|uniref:cupin domain-containing protein n=1 Tax=Dyella silvatica TaxID=2992128 RepID=UPI0022527F8D|nr:cupin domain-containing protein [Dyella silvatica]